MQNTARKKVVERGAHACPPDPAIARLLAAQFAHDHRVGFARSFTQAVVAACRRARGLLETRPDGLMLSPLSAEAAKAAASLGAAAAGMQPKQAAYFIGTTYTAALPDTHRAAHGIFYTPPELVEHLLAMAEQAGVAWENCRTLDPACGGGAFLVAAALRIRTALDGTDPAFILQRIGAKLRGFDIDPFGAWLAQAQLDLALQDLVDLAERPLPTIVDTRDALALNVQDAGSYDLVIGNPPYGRVSLQAERRELFQRGIYGHANLYSLFTDAALRLAKQGGIIAYVTPTSMLSGLYYKALRRLLAEEAPPLSVNFVTKRHGVFENVLQETMLATYRKGGLALGGGVGFIVVNPDGSARRTHAGRFSLPARPETPWLLPRLPTQAALTRRLRSMPHRLADYGYGVSTGPLVWNRHKDQFRTEPETETFPVIWAESVTSDGRFLWRSEKRNHVPWFKANRPKDDWLIVTQPCVLLQRTTAKEQARRLIAGELPESFIRRHRGVIIENHLNMVRAIVAKPTVSASVIAALLNSAAADAAFRCINGSVAVSAFELEELPVPAPPVMSRLAQLIRAGSAPAKIEMTVAAAYGKTNLLRLCDENSVPTPRSIDITGPIDLGWY